MSKLVSQTIAARLHPLSGEIIARQNEIQLDLRERYTSVECELLQDSTAHILANLAQALDLDSPALFSDFISWLKVYLESRDIPVRDLRINLHCVQQILTLHFGRDEGNILAEYLDAARAELEKTMPYLYTTELRGEHASLAHEYLAALLSGEEDRAISLAVSALDRGLISRSDLFLRVLQPVQHEIGRLWQFNQIEPDRAAAAACAVYPVLDQISGSLPPLADGGPSMLMLCPAEEQHLLAARLVADSFTAAGWHVLLPEDAPDAPAVIDLLLSRGINLLAISLTLPVHIRSAEKLIAEIRASDAGRVHILVGGAPFNLAPFLWRRIGADGCAADAESALRLAQDLLIRG